VTHILVGDTRSRAILKELEARGWGRMFSEGRPTPFEGERWGLDNGAFGAWLRGQPFPADRFQKRVDDVEERGLVPEIAVTPDLVTKGIESLEFSLGWLERLPTTWPWYLAVQDGMTPEDVAPVLTDFRGIFLGGSTRFKSTAATWRKLADQHHKRFHYARAGVPNRIQHAIIVGADSLDSAFPLWTNARFQEFIAELVAPASPVFPLVAAWMRRPLEGDALTGCAP
jgi:hypothetical protein